MLINEKRSAFRLKDTVKLGFTILSDEEEKQLAKQLESDSDTNNDFPSQADIAMAPKTVNLSVSGMAFSIDEEIKAGSKLAMSFILSPSETNVLTIADVVACDRDSTDASQYLLRVNFETISEPYKIALSEYMNKKLETLRG